MTVGSRLIFREGSTKGLGEVTRIIQLDENIDGSQDENNVKNETFRDLSKSNRKQNRLKSTSTSIVRGKLRSSKSYLANRNTNKKGSKHDGLEEKAKLKKNNNT